MTNLERLERDCANYKLGFEQYFNACLKLLKERDELLRKLAETK